MIHFSKAAAVIEEHHQPEAQDDRNNNAQCCNDHGCFTGFFQVLNIGFKAGGKHQNNNAELRHLSDKIGFF